MKQPAFLRIIAALLTTALFCGMISGCTPKRHKKIPLLEDVLKRGDLKEVTLTFYFQGREGKYTREVLDEVEKRSKDRLNVKLDFKWISSNSYLSDIRKITASDAPCDAFYYTGTRGAAADNIKKLSVDGVLLNISALFPRYAPGYFRKLSEDELKAIKIDDTIYGIPNRMPTANRRYAVVKDDLMKKYNIPEIKNYRDFEFYMSTVKEHEPGIFPLMMNNTAIALFAEAGGYVVLDAALGLVYKWEDPGMKLMAWEQTPEYREGIKILNAWCRKEYMSRNFRVLTRPDNAIVTSGRLASTIGQQTTEVSYNTLLRYNNILDWGFREYPLYADKVVQRNSPADNMMLFCKNSANPERAIMFIEWLQSSQENYDLLMYGIKGKHYDLYGNQYTLPKEEKLDDAHLNWNGKRAFMNIDYERYSTVQTPDYIKAYIESIKSGTKYPPHTGFYPDYRPVLDVARNREKTNGSVEPGVNRSYFSMDKVDEYIKEQKNAGVERLLTTVQSQLDAWRASKDKKNN